MFEDLYFLLLTRKYPEIKTNKFTPIFPPLHKNAIHKLLIYDILEKSKPECTAKWCATIIIIDIILNISKFVFLVNFLSMKIV